MCGIAGYIGLAPPTPEKAAECLAAMRHRGPDGLGEYRFRLSDGRFLCLLHTRLSIIDHDERSNQPFRDGKLVLACNGELYNYLELRERLTADGEIFRTESDTEVLARILLRRGVEGLDECEGMWAFAAFDEAAERLILCRDRFGEKPLYIHQTAEGIYFASEIKFIFRLLGRRLPVDRRHVGGFLALGYRFFMQGGQSFFTGIERLPAASVMSISAGTALPETVIYWRLAYRPDAAMERGEAVALAREALIRSVGLRLRADTSLAFCLSGGVDSNSLLAIARRVHGFDAHGFTIVNTDSRYEEADMVAATVGELGIRHTQIPLEKKNFLERLQGLVAAHDAPVATLTFYLHSLLMSAMADAGYKVVISGTGADELFTGYYDHHLAYLREVRNDPQLHAASLAAWNSRVAPVITNPHLKNPGLFIENPEFRDHLTGEASDIRNILPDVESRTLPEMEFCSDMLRNRMLNELSRETVPLYLHEEDLNAMAVSVENRAPFLDRHLCETCFSIPTHLLIKDGLAKSILRDAMRGIVPDPIIDNPRKVGFNAPILDLLDVGNRDVRNEILADGPLFELVDRKALAALLKPDQLPNSTSKLLFSLISVKLFLEEFGT